VQPATATATAITRATILTVTQPYRASPSENASVEVPGQDGYREDEREVIAVNCSCQTPPRTNARLHTETAMPGCRRPR
jgi:hypothetical protein